ncbi:TIGR03085 family protein [Pedococcus dokdonensis]|uniref:TIGR03085 family protein n=1 Tax=Pedococcus dokdonensis TaxID=443156 RepID=A0A1H0QNH0_9MICO|nr:TIGR03085 family metal-binding protein [Pedococcus dokdonensis]SDP18218.1 TIGR03085 family protein [Pedococcus dokdonensis]
MPWVQLERSALAATFAATDPEQPTLCEGWTVRHLLAHLVQRERRPLARAIDQLSRNKPGQERRLGTLVDRARTAKGYDELLARFARGPSRWSPLAWADETVNFLEYVIHHEDVRRGGTPPLAPRQLAELELEAIWSRLGTVSRLSYRHAPVGVTFALPAGRGQVVHRGEHGVVVTGDPVELLLCASGRQRAAHVELAGSPESVRRFETWRNS